MLSSVLLLPLIFSTVAKAQELQERQAGVGDSRCGQFMCVAASVNGSSVDYVLSSTGRATAGWMGVGFGRAMPNTPMVIMWANSDGSITLSQRSARGFVMPTVDNNPPRLATFQQALSSTSSGSAKFAFSIPANGEKTQNIIFAFGTINPNSAAVDAVLAKHLDFGGGQLDLTKQNTPSPTQSVTAPAVTARPLDEEDLPLPSYQRLIVAHAAFCIIGFLLFLPAGALVGRYLRTFTSVWFKSHRIIQLVFAGPFITIGVALGVHSVNKAGLGHFNDIHKRLGLVLFIFYVAQCFLGALIHSVKPKNISYRPPQNYVHAVFGLFLIGLALYQVRLGYKVEWPRVTNRGPVPNGVDVIFWIWVTLLPIAYGLGLGFLKRQYRQEHKARHRSAKKYEDDDQNDH